MKCSYTTDFIYKSKGASKNGWHSLALPFRRLPPPRDQNQSEQSQCEQSLLFFLITVYCCDIYIYTSIFQMAY